jgi:nitrilase
VRQVIVVIHGSKTILTAELNFSLITRAKLDFDVTGHYARPDIFQLIVNEKKQQSVRFEGDDV